MQRWLRVLGLLAVAAALTGVASAQVTLDMQQRVLRESDLPGFKVDRPPEIFHSAAAWYQVRRSGLVKQSAALKARGFVVGAREDLAGLNAQATSAVIEFKASRGARATLAQFITDARSGSYKLRKFAVPGIPGALGVVSWNVNEKVFTIAFADGRFWYGVGLQHPPNAARPRARTSLIAAARALYRRVHSA
jgi:hypothetical protein